MEIDKNKKYKFTYANLETGEHGTFIAKGSDVFVGHDPYNAVEQGEDMAEYLGILNELNALAQKMYDLSDKNDVEMLRPYALLLEEMSNILYREIC